MVLASGDGGGTAALDPTVVGDVQVLCRSLDMFLRDGPWFGPGQGLGREPSLELSEAPFQFADPLGQVVAPTPTGLV